MSLSDDINRIYFDAVRQFRAAGYGKVECHLAAMAAMNGNTYCRRTGETAHHLTLRSVQIIESNKSFANDAEVKS
jgi:hypothetical protein